MIAITNWLQSERNYHQGVALYEQYGQSAFYKKLFASRSDAATQAKLLELLSQLAPANTKKPQVISVVPVVTPALVINAGTDNKKYLDLLKRKGNLYTQLNFLMAHRLSLPDGAELRDCAFEILATNQKLRECWAQIDYYQEHGKFEDENTAQIVEMPADQRAQYLRQSISKCKKRLESPGCRDREATQKLLDERLAELAILKPKKQKTV